ncbi:MAG: hypothetical protein R3D25_07775 [Geminicoccaceae bacterium]
MANLGLPPPATGSPSTGRFGFVRRQAQYTRSLHLDDYQCRSASRRWAA